MVNLENDTPYFYWTFDKIEDLTAEQIECGFEGSVWKGDVIPSYAIGESFLTFASPEEWGVDDAPVRFHRTPDGRYEHRSNGIAYDAVRADLERHPCSNGARRRSFCTSAGLGSLLSLIAVRTRSLEGLVALSIAEPILGPSDFPRNRTFS
jgi:hypothetical protein